MSHLSRRAATAAFRLSHTTTPIRALASTSDSTHTTSSVLKPAKQPAGPYPVPKTTFPVYKDPWATPTAEKPGPPTKKYSDRTIKLVQGLARIMGYNSRTSTAIRETSRMMRGIVEAVERDSAFWYDGGFGSSIGLIR
jgi:cytochrome b pre-mRNA-processing protein 3